MIGVEEGMPDDMDGVSNGGERIIVSGVPYIATIKVKGVCPMMFHAWNVEAVDAKANAAKGSKEKKTDDVESYVYRNEKKQLCIPGMYLHACICGKNGAAKYRQDPRSPRKSALDLYRSGIAVLTDLASLGTKTWDYIDARRVTVQLSSITRMRPCVHAGWEAEFEVMVNLAEYINEQDLHDVITNAGKFCGFGDMRPSYGRFQIVKFQTTKA